MELFAQKTGIIYDPIFNKHKSNQQHIQKPQRVKGIIKLLQLKHYLTHPKIQYMNKINRKATNQQLLLVHTQKYLKHIQTLWPNNYHRNYLTILDSYFNQETQNVCKTAIGGVLTGVDKLHYGNWQNCFAVVRPPGHHSGYRNTINGYCIFNNVALAAKYAIEKYNYKRVLVLDWDLHHGDGTQSVLNQYPNTLFISIHRYDRGNFYPVNEQGNYTNCGKGVSQGLNINIPLNFVNQSNEQYNFQAPGDNQYVYIFNRIVQPILYSYQPDFIIVAAGFDAARFDQHGGFTITPNGYYYMTKKLMEIAAELGTKNNKKMAERQKHPIPLLFVLEGGYNVTSTSLSVCAVVSALIQQNEFPQKMSLQYKDLKDKVFLEEMISDQLQQIIDFYSKYWPILKSEDLKQYTERIKANKYRLFGVIEQYSQQSSQDSDNQQNTNQQKANIQDQSIKKKISKNEKLKIMYQLENQQQQAKNLMNQFYFAGGHIQRFKNFNLQSPQVQKWAYDSQIKFYENDFQQKLYAPKYFGRQGSYVILENLLFEQEDPVVMDIKLSRQSKNLLNKESKVQKQKKKQMNSTASKYAFRITGYTSPQFKQGGLLSNTQQSVNELLLKVVSSKNKQIFIQFIINMVETLKQVNRKYYGTSLILIKGKYKSAIKWVDFHYWVGDCDQYDKDLVEGLENVKMFIENLVIQD